MESRWCQIRIGRAFWMMDGTRLWFLRRSIGWISACRYSICNSMDFFFLQNPPVSVSYWCVRLPNLFDIFHPSSYMNLGKRSGYLQVKKQLFLKPFSRNTPPMILLLMRIKYGCMTGWIWNKASQGKLPDWQNGRTSNYRHTFITTERSRGT